MCLERRRDGGLSMHSLHFSAALSASHTLIHCVMLLLWVSQGFCALVKWPQHFTIMGSEHENTLKPYLPPLSCSLLSTLIMSLYEIFSSISLVCHHFPSVSFPWFLCANVWTELMSLMVWCAERTECGNLELHDLENEETRENNTGVVKVEDDKAAFLNQDQRSKKRNACHDDWILYKFCINMLTC